MNNKTFKSYFWKIDKNWIFGLKKEKKEMYGNGDSRQREQYGRPVWTCGRFLGKDDYNIDGKVGCGQIFSSMFWDSQERPKIREKNSKKIQRPSKGVLD